MPDSASHPEISTAYAQPVLRGTSPSSSLNTAHPNDDSSSDFDLVYGVLESKGSGSVGIEELMDANRQLLPAVKTSLEEQGTLDDCVQLVWYLRFSMQRCLRK